MWAGASFGIFRVQLQPYSRAVNTHGDAGMYDGSDGALWLTAETDFSAEQNEPQAAVKAVQLACHVSL
jgi:hypothetical protein